MRKYVCFKDQKALDLILLLTISFVLKDCKMKRYLMNVATKSYTFTSVIEYLYTYMRNSI